MNSVTIERKTTEVDIVVTLGLNGNGTSKIDTSLGFFDHLLMTLAKHAQFDLEVTAKGDLKHHIIEDVGICIGQALKELVRAKSGLTRFGFQYIPMDDALTRVVIDISGRPYFRMAEVTLNNFVEDIAVEDLKHFLEVLALQAQITLHVDILAGNNTHHIIEAVFKALAHALRKAVIKRLDLENKILSTKGTL
ncbi:MAG: imidazoleglycerol-phosphate dehydratase HisB [Candidatus Heimdallarchaeota archaeon]|nr:imidazoleglycerol-phosphate dehydratase HisB [Candidatus Heimdallarchaeota archaeon]